MLLENSLLELTLLDRAWGQKGHQHPESRLRWQHQAGADGTRAETASEQELWRLAAQVEPEEQRASEDMGTGHRPKFPLELTAAQNSTGI